MQKRIKQVKNALIVFNWQIDMLKEISLIDGYLLGGLSLKVDELETFIDKLK